MGSRKQKLRKLPNVVSTDSDNASKIPAPPPLDRPTHSSSGISGGKGGGFPNPEDPYGLSYPRVKSLP